MLKHTRGIGPDFLNQIQALRIQQNPPRYRTSWFFICPFVFRQSLGLRSK